ncbi:MAG: DUF1844 domain-containing protein [Candidatus Marinimicrobia bacterium CG08_land_8_20_14_0_20_45_22]|nr:MAG: DUF1844 domain-containing protein [Candidatus Marinimicrobia bacterium CG08_land_8_20_14_0_20_45_22]
MANEKMDKNQMLFAGLLQSLVASGWIYLGKRQNTATAKVEVNLDEASFTIDMIEMLKEKTRGNLTDAETQVLERSLSELKMNFVEEKLKTEKNKPESPSET